MPYDANHGRHAEYEGVQAFASIAICLRNITRVGSSEDEILQRLNGLINKPLKVRILDSDHQSFFRILVRKRL